MNNTSLYNALTVKTIQTRGESVSKPLNTEAAVDVRDALVKGVYGRMFIWLIDKINQVIYKVNRDPRHIRKSIGVLDIFGFENFDFNRSSYNHISYSPRHIATDITKNTRSRTVERKKT